MRKKFIKAWRLKSASLLLSSGRNSNFSRQFVYSNSGSIIPKQILFPMSTWKVGRLIWSYPLPTRKYFQYFQRVPDPPSYSRRAELVDLHPEIFERKENMNAYQAPVDIPNPKHSSKCDQHTTLCHILLYPEQFPSNSSYENKLATIYRENVSSLYCRFRRSTRRRSYTGKTQHSLVRSKTSRKNWSYISLVDTRSS